IQSQSILKQLTKKGMEFKRVLTTSSLEVITALVSSGSGIGILPGRVAERIRSLGLRPLIKDGPRFLDSICLIYRADAQKSKASRMLAKTIEEQINAQAEL